MTTHADIDWDSLRPSTRRARIRVHGLCWFVHVHKCAGTSMRKTLWGNNLGLMVINTGHPPYKWWHIRSASVDLSSKFSFAFVRNPWDRLASAYKGARLNISFEEFISLAMDDGLPDRRYAGPAIKLNTQLRKHVKRRRLIGLRLHTRPYHHQNYMLDRVKFIGKFENIAEDWAYVMEQIGKPEIDLPHINVSKRTVSYKSMYTPETRDTVAKYYADDIAKYGYSFDD